MSCNPPSLIIDGVEVSTSDFENAKELLQKIGDDVDPTHDEREENSANGNNSSGTTGVQFPPAAQTSPPGEITEKPEAQEDKKPPENNGAPVSCSTWTGDYNFQLSPNFTVKNFTIGAVFKNQLIDAAGLTAAQRCCNLQNLAANVAEPLRARFGNFNINSAIRNSNTTPSPRVSQHVSGQAMDVQFPGWNYEMYWNNAAWVRDNIPYDQFIFEHSSATGLAWYHLSYNPNGNRPNTDPFKCCTMYRNKYSPGLKKFG